MELNYIIEFGYLAIWIGTIIEGETFLLMAALAASYGLLDLRTVILLAYLGSLTGDLIFFGLGRLQGRGFLDSRPHWRVRADKVLRLVSRHKIKVLVLYRFVYGFRGVTPFIFGLTRMPAWRFFQVVALTALVWSSMTGGLGYLLGDRLKGWGVTFSEIQFWFLGTTFLALLLYILGNKIRQSPGKKQKEHNEA
ncbi:MAG: DedA family protein [Proteobacteria bacterium]|nr:DedA family protein [Pseudomonadota bacterium]